jgi:hypothetical protein
MHGGNAPPRSSHPWVHGDHTFRLLRGARSGYERACAGYVGAIPNRGADMANPVPAGSDVSAGTYKCTNCGYELEVGSTKNLPPCPSCHNGQYETLSGGDSVQDPYPGR